MSDTSVIAERRRAAIRSRDSFLDRWHEEQRPALQTIRQRAESMLDDLDLILTCREFGYGKDINQKLRAYGAAVAGETIDLLSELHGQILKEADEAGLDQGLLSFDYSDLQQELERWS